MPDFTDPVVFPTFLTIPEQDPSGGPPPPPAPEDSWYLLAQVKDNMTINKPTLVLTDRDGSPFALVFEGLGRDDLDLRGLGLKKGATAVIRNARRVRPEDESKRGFVRVEKGDASSVVAVPGALARVLELGGKVKGRECEVCGSEGDGEGGLKGCTGCGRAGYCSKVSVCAVCGEDSCALSCYLRMNSRSVKSRGGVKGATRASARS